MQLRITFNPGTHILANAEHRRHLAYRDGVNELCNAMIANRYRPDLVAMAREKATAGYYEQAYISDVALYDLLKSGVVAAVDLDDTAEQAGRHFTGPLMLPRTETLTPTELKALTTDDLSVEYPNAVVVRRADLDTAPVELSPVPLAPTPVLPATEAGGAGERETSHDEQFYGSTR